MKKVLVIEDDEIMGLKSGAYDYIVKPFNIKVVMEKIFQN
jgi:DNA-binding response OmpR family regulator